jgi:protocatechuate 3,4-dioxygenase alpha subunit
MPVEHLKESPSQTAGPYVHIGTYPAAAGLEIRKDEKLNVLVDKSGRGKPIRITGIIYDGAGDPVRDAMVEIWQADADGRFNSPDFFGWGRAVSNFDTGLITFETIKPGVTPWRDGRPQAPHLQVLIFARGINIHLHTRLYFADEEKANAADPVLARVPASRRQTLIAERAADGGSYRFVIRLQGEAETVFFDV